MINVLMGACPTGKSDRAVAVAKHTILSNTDAEVNIEVRGDGSGRTGFQNIRWSLWKREGFWIYVDSDIMFFGDIAELYDYRQSHKWVGTPSRDKQRNALRDGSMPCVVDCTNMPQAYSHLNLTSAGYYTCGIPEVWNHLDYCDKTTKLLHLSRQFRQPWNPEADLDREIDSLWLDYEADMK